MHDMPVHTNLPAIAGETGKIYILSEGLFNMNNSTLCCINFEKKTVEYDFFSLLNNRGLGDTANDMKIYGGKLWIIVNVSSQIEVVDVTTGFSIRRIPFFDATNKARQPRYISFYQNKAYVCSFDGTVSRIDTTNLQVDAVIQCGRNPDGIAIANGKLYVSNSGGLNAPQYDNTVSVIDIASFTEIKKITVGLNPSTIAVDGQGDVYVASRGDNINTQACWQRINSSTDAVVETFYDLPVRNFTIQHDTAYLYSFDFTTHRHQIKTFDCTTEKIIANNFVTDGTLIESPFGISTHPTNGNVYIADARTFTIRGNLFCFDRNGKKKYTIENIGLNPNTVLVCP